MSVQIGNTQCMWGSDRLILIEHTPQRILDRARQFINACLSGKVGFCYSLVKRYPLDTGRELRQEMERLKKERMNAGTIRKRGDVITRKLKDMRAQEREHYQYDMRAYRTLRSNYDRLKKALTLLYTDGEIDSYTVQTNGRLVVNWFTGWTAIEVIKMENGWTYRSTAQDDPYDYTCALRKRVFDLYSTINPDIPTPPSGFLPDYMNTSDQFNNSGWIDKEVTGPSGGPESLDPAVLRQRDEDNARHKIEHKALYVQGAEERELKELKPLFD